MKSSLLLDIYNCIYRFLFLGIRNDGGIYRIPVSGMKGRTNRVIHSNCPYSMTLNIKTGDIYTLDSCSNFVKSCKIDGSSQKMAISNIGYGFVYGSSMFGEKLFWSQISGGSTVKYFNMNTTTSYEIFQRNTDIFMDIAVVHSSNQPSGLVIAHFLL